MVEIAACDVRERHPTKYYVIGGAKNAEACFIPKRKLPIVIIMRLRKKNTRLSYTETK